MIKFLPLPVFVYTPPNISRDIRDEKIELRYRTGILLELNYRYKRARLSFITVILGSDRIAIFYLIIFPALCYDHLRILVHR